VLIGKADGGMRQTPLFSAEAGTITYRNTAKLDETMRMTSEGVTTATGMFAGQLRSIAMGYAAAGPVTAALNALKQRGRPNATGEFTITTPTGLAAEYSIGAKFTSQPGQNIRVMEAGLRVLLPAGDYLMGRIGNTKLKDTDPTPCYSGRQTEDLTLEFPANRTVARLPADADVKTANLHFTSHWALNGQTLSVHREFVSMIDQPLCAGDVRKETASALARIRSDYTVPISLVTTTAAPVSATFAADERRLRGRRRNRRANGPSNKAVLPARKTRRTSIRWRCPNGEVRTASS
jgi:hypothetical protein